MKNLTLGLSLLALTTASAAAQTTLTILSTNDVDQYAALGPLSAIVAGERAKGDNVLFLHAGDSYSPSILAGFDQGAHMVDLLNLISPDYMVIGNHEFDFGPEAMVANLANTTFPMLSGNIVTGTGEPVPHTQATAMVDVGDFKVGIFGLTTQEAEVKSSTGDYDITDFMAAAQMHASDLRDAGAHLVVAVAHLGIGEDFTLVNSGLVDVLVTGDDHNQLTWFDGRTAMMESGEQAEVVTALDITMSMDDRDRFRWSPAFRIISTDNVGAVSSVAAEIAALDASLSEELGEVIGTTATELNTTRPVIRGQEATFGNLLTDAMRAAVGSDVALTNGGGIRAKAVYAPGQEITAGDILAELPFGNKTVMLEVTGAQIIAALENGFSKVEEGAGRYPHISGMRVVADLTAEPGSRVQSLLIGGVPVESADTYTLATNDYMAGGGDGYTMFRDATTLLDADASILMATQLIDYIRAAGNVAPQIEGRISQ